MNKILITALTTAILLVSPLLFVAAAPSHAPSSISTNVTVPLHQGSVAQSKVGGLIVNSGNATFGLLIPNGSVGISTLSPGSLFDIFGTSLLSVFSVASNGNVNVGNVAAPGAKLSINGGMQVGDDTAACVAAKYGTLRWHSGALQYCNSQGWKAY